MGIQLFKVHLLKKNLSFPQVMADFPYKVNIHESL